MTSFVKDDLELLSERYDVRVFEFAAHQADTRAGRLRGLLAYGLRQLRWLVRELPEASLVYGWFADYHLVLPVLLARQVGVPVAVPLAGFDAIELPALGYGVYNSSWRAALARWVLRRATLLLPVSETMIYSENQYSEYPESARNGVRHHVPGLETPYAVVPFGYDPDAWPMGPAERAPVVCTVGHMTSDRTLRRKGVDLFFEAACRLPEVMFRVVGVPEARMPAIRAQYAPPANVELAAPVPRGELPAVYGEASVYAQLSRAEGQPNVLCEAMCCGCIPVGSKVFGIPETIGDTGFVVERPLAGEIAAALEGALETATPERRRAARGRITERFTREQRREKLFAILEHIEQRR